MEPRNIDTGAQVPNTNAPTGVNREALGAERAPNQVHLADLEWGHATTVRAVGYRFLVPVPHLGSENEDVAVKDWTGAEKTVVGLAFRNATDSALQAVSGEGKGVLIFAVDAEKVDRVQFSQAMFAAIDSMGGAAAFNKESLLKLISMLPTIIEATAISKGTLQKADVYDSDDSIAANLAPQSGLIGEGERPFGLYEKADKPGPVALYVEGPSEVFGGPHASSAQYGNGFMAVRIPPKKEGGDPSYRSIAPEAISYCYVMADGAPIKTFNLPQG